MHFAKRGKRMEIRNIGEVCGLGMGFRMGYMVGSEKKLFGTPFCFSLIKARIV
jgi:hypothetical protein